MKKCPKNLQVAQFSSESYNIPTECKLDLVILQRDDIVYEAIGIKDSVQYQIAWDIIALCTESTYCWLRSSS